MSMMYFEEDCQLGFGADDQGRRRADPLLDGIGGGKPTGAAAMGFGGADFPGAVAMQPASFYQ